MTQNVVALPLPESTFEQRFRKKPTRWQVQYQKIDKNSDVLERKPEEIVDVGEPQETFFGAFFIATSLHSKRYKAEQESGLSVTDPKFYKHCEIGAIWINTPQRSPSPPSKRVLKLYKLK